MTSDVVRWLAGAGVALALALVAGDCPAQADEAAQTLTASTLEAGKLADGEEQLAAILAKDPANNDARLGLATVQFVRAIEHVSQGFYRYGLRAPPNAILFPLVRIPVPVNPDPQPITFEDFQGLVRDFVADLGKAEATLAAMGPGEVRLPLDLRKISYDVKGDGSMMEPFIALLERVSDMKDEDLANSLYFVFDRGDALWLRGYCHLLMAFGEFFLAHDWHESFNYTFHVFFPKANLPFTGQLYNEGGNDFNDIADLISFLHIRWPVSEPARMKAVREHLKAVVALSRQSWDAIEAETDNDNEWLPNPRQTGRFAAVTVTEAQVDAWRAMLDEADLILDGKKLVPHWRFNQGFNLRRVFDEPQPFDFVLWITGPAALPYLENGPIETSEEWNAILAAFGGRFSQYAAWFN